MIKKAIEWTAALMLAVSANAQTSETMKAIVERPEFNGLSSAVKEELISELKPTMEIRWFLDAGLKEFDAGDDVSQKKALLRLRLLIEQINSGERDPNAICKNAHMLHSADEVMHACFFSQAWFFKLYDRLADAGLIDQETRQQALQIADTYLKPAERGSNNRPFHYALGQAYALQQFPGSTNAPMWKAYSEAVWNDFYVPGDNYEPGYVHAYFPQAIELGLLLGKEKELKGDKLRQMFYRLRDHIGPGGLVVSPGDGWGQDDYVDGLIAATDLTGDETLLWAAERLLLAGTAGYTRGRNGRRIPESEQQGLLNERLGFLYARGLHAKMPETASAVSYLYPATYRIADRLILNPSRKEGNPFAAFYLNDRQNTTFHGHEDNRGDLYHYEVDGVLYLCRSGWSKWPGMANTFVVSDSTLEFPYNQTGGMASNHWYRASENLRVLLDYQDSENWKDRSGFDESPPRRYCNPDHYLGDHPVNPDGLAGKLDNLTIQTVSIQLLNFPREEIMKEKDHYLKNLSFDRGWVAWYRDYRKIAPSDGPYEILLSNLFIAGQKGEQTLEKFARIPENLKLLYYAPGSKGQPPVELDKSKALSIVKDPATGTSVLKMMCPPGRTDLVLDVSDRTFNLNSEYHRIGCMYQYRSDVSEFLRTPMKIAVNGFAPRSMYVDNQQGGILIDTKVDQRDGDCFGSMTFDGVWTYDSSWTRQTLLSKEGLLVVVDRFLPGSTADGMIGGPVWQLFNPPESGLNWFDSMQDRETGNKLLTFFHYQRGIQYGVQFQPKLWWMNDYAVYAKKRFSANQPEIFVTAFVPHDGGLSGVDVSGLPNYLGAFMGRSAKYGMRTAVESNGTAEVRWKPKPKAGLIGGKGITVRIAKDGTWSVAR